MRMPPGMHARKRTQGQAFHRLLTCLPIGKYYPRMTRGSELFRAALDKREMSAYAAAKQLGIDQTYVGRLLKGSRKAGLRVALLIEEQFDVPVAAWDESDTAGDAA